MIANVIRSFTGHANNTNIKTNNTLQYVQFAQLDDATAPEQGEHIRSHCNRMTWSVHKAGLVVRFDGLTYGVDLAREKRRRLLWRGRTGCEVITAYTVYY